MQKGVDMESFTGLLPAIYSLFHKKRTKRSHPWKPNQASLYGNSDLKVLHDACVESMSISGIKAANPSLEYWKLVRQSSVDQLISRSTRGSAHIDFSDHSRRSHFWNPVPRRAYAKLKKRMQYAFISSTAEVRRHQQHRLDDSARFGRT